MFPKLAVSAVALAIAVLASVPISAAYAGSWTPVEIRRATPDAAAGKVALNEACVWTRLRGWHRSGWLGTWHACQPGPEWRYQNRCWIGPANERHCRFYG